MVIIRTSWLYSPWGQNFLKTMIRLMKERSMIKIVNDQWGSPTYAPDLAEAVIRIIQAEDFVPGIYHFSNEGKISWYEFARAIKEMIRSECELFPITTEEYPTAAKRPKFSLLDCSKIQIIYGVKLKPWHSSLKACVNRLILMK